MQSHPLIFCITFCISIGLIFFPLNPQYTFRSVPHRQRVFDVSVNGEKLIDSLNLADSYGEQTAVVKTLVVNVRNHEGLEILLSPQKGQGVISGLKVKKIR